MLITDFLESGSLIRLDKDHYLVGWGNRFYSNEPSSEENPWFYFPDFFLQDSKPWFYHEHAKLISANELIELFPQTFSKKLIWKSPYKNQFQEAFLQLKNLIQTEHLKKAVPYIFETSSEKFSKELLLSSLSSIINRSKETLLHVYGFWNHKEGMLGASPEILFKYSSTDYKKLETIACAGTTNKIDLQQFLLDSKEAEEHQLVVEGIKQSLSSFGKVRIGQRQILELSTLSHLVTPIEVVLEKPIDFNEATKALHPTPALGAFPKEPGLIWLESYNQLIPRGRYGAPVGCLFNNETKCIVAIRNLQWNEHEAKIGAGCGIVKGSVLENEWNEIQIKISLIKELLSL